MAVPPPASLRTLLTDPAQQRRFFYVWLFQVEGVAEAILNADRRLIDFLWQTWSPGLTLAGAHRERVHAMYGDPRFIQNALRMYRANFDTSLHDPALASLGERTEAPAGQPLLLLGAEDDGCIAASMFTGAEQGLGPGSRVEILPGAGHFMHLEQPATVAELALEWFRSG